jgi:hypothetical protein
LAEVVVQVVTLVAAHPLEAEVIPGEELVPLEAEAALEVDLEVQVEGLEVQVEDSEVQAVDSEAREADSGVVAGLEVAMVVSEVEDLGLGTGAEEDLLLTGLVLDVSDIFSSAQILVASWQICP